MPPAHFAVAAPPVHAAADAACGLGVVFSHLHQAELAVLLALMRLVPKGLPRCNILCQAGRVGADA